MTNENKELLLKDLCARLPYGVKVNADIHGTWTLIGITHDRVFTDCECEGKHNDFPVEFIKPYLRPMSSMTEEEEKEYVLLSNRCIITSVGFVYIEVQILMDWLNAHHFDYRGLIPMGLALNYKGTLSFSKENPRERIVHNLAEFDNSLFPDLKIDKEPIEVELTINKV